MVLRRYAGASPVTSTTDEKYAPGILFRVRVFFVCKDYFGLKVKILAALLCVVLAVSVFVLVACVKDPDDPQPDNPPQPQKTVYDMLNELAAKSHDSGKLTMITTIGDDVLTNIYTLTTTADVVEVII